MDEKDLLYSEVIRVLRTDDDIRAGVVEEEVRKRFVCGGGYFRRDVRHIIVISCGMKPTLGSL